jgi:ribosomal protein S20
MTDIDSLRLTKCNNYLKKILVFCDESDKSLLKKTINKYNEKIEKYNKENIIVLNPTNREIGNFNKRADSLISKTENYLNKQYNLIIQDIEDNFIEGNIHISCRYNTIDWSGYGKYRASLIDGCKECKNKYYTFRDKLRNYLNEFDCFNIDVDYVYNIDVSKELKDSYILNQRQDKSILKKTLKDVIELNIEEELYNNNKEYIDILTIKKNNYETSKQQIISSFSF